MTLPPLYGRCVSKRSVSPPRSRGIHLPPAFLVSDLFWGGGVFCVIVCQRALSALEVVPGFPCTLLGGISPPLDEVLQPLSLPGGADLQHLLDLVDIRSIDHVRRGRWHDPLVLRDWGYPGPQEYGVEDGVYPPRVRQLELVRYRSHLAYDREGSVAPVLELLRGPVSRQVLA